MKTLILSSRISFLTFSIGACLSISPTYAQSTPANPYKIIKSTQVTGTGRTDYVFADSDERRLYVPWGGEIQTFDLDTLKQTRSIPNARAHDVAVDPKSRHGFSSSNPVVMWNSKTLETIKTIPVQGRPDGIMLEPETDRILVFSHSAPNVTMIDPKEGSVLGTIDLGGAPEQAASDGSGHLYVDLEDKNSVAVVDLKTLKVTANYDLGGKGGPAGMGFDTKNRVLFVFCREPATAVMLNADNGKILATLPIGEGTDGGGFNPATMEAFSSQRDGTLTIIKENSPTKFDVEQTVQTWKGARTSTLDTKTNHIILIALERPSTPAPTVSATSGAPARATSMQSPSPSQAGGQPAGEGRRGGNDAPGLLHILVVGRE